MKIIVVALFVIVGVAVFLTSNKKEPVITGSMTIQKMLCAENDDQSVTFSLLAFNTTNQHLKNLNVGLNVANGSNIRQKTINMRVVEEGEPITLEEVVDFDDEVTACFVKFSQGEQEIEANFRPTGGKYEKDN